MENKPNQHYVWQKYLEPWKKDGKIVCLRNKKNIIQSTPRNIASQRYFYNINSLTLNDCKWIRSIFIDGVPEAMKSLLEGWIIPFEDFLKLYNSATKYEKMRDSIKTYKELAFKNILEEVHMKIESAGMPGLYKIQAGNVSFISECKDESKEADDFILYLCFQYLRTKKMKQNVKESLGKDASIFTNFDNAFNLIVPILATRLMDNLISSIKSKEFQCYLLENTSEIPFITGDQPLINIHASLDNNVETSNLAFYYPLSPTMSLLITKEQICNNKCSIEKVKEYNDMIERQSLELIFAKDESTLHPYILH